MHTLLAMTFQRHHIIGFVLFLHYGSSGRGVAAAMCYLAALPISIALHELAHFVAARRNGIPVREIHLTDGGPSRSWTTRDGRKWSVALSIRGGRIVIPALVPGSSHAWRVIRRIALAGPVTTVLVCLAAAAGVALCSDGAARLVWLALLIANAEMIFSGGLANDLQMAAVAKRRDMAKLKSWHLPGEPEFRFV